MADHDPSDLFEEPLKSIQENEEAGDFYHARRDSGTARDYYNKALQTAATVPLDLISDDGPETVERLRYKVQRIDNAHNPAFRNLENAAKPDDPFWRRNSAWASYQRSEENPAGCLAARGLGPKEDFRKRLDDPNLTPLYDDDEDVR